MRIQFVSEKQAEMANATLSEALIKELTEKSDHPIASRKGLGMAYIPALPDTEIKVVVNKSLQGHSPARVVVTDQETIDKIVAELSGAAPKVAKASKKKS